MLVNFNRFKGSFYDLEHVRCKNCNRRFDCKVVERYKNTYQPKNNHNYFDDYGCYQVESNREVR